MSTTSEVPETVIHWRAIEREQQRNSFNRTWTFEAEIDELCRTKVPEAAALLDEHVPGWHLRVTGPIRMGSTLDCVLGQVFDERHYIEPSPRRFFGLLPPRKREPSYPTPGYIAGLAFFKRRGLHVHPFVFSSHQAAPFWGAEISRRST